MCGFKGLGMRLKGLDSGLKGLQWHIYCRARSRPGNTLATYKAYLPLPSVVLFSLSAYGE